MTLAAWPTARPRYNINPWPAALVVGLSAYIVARAGGRNNPRASYPGRRLDLQPDPPRKRGWTLVRLIPADPIYTGALASLLSDVDAVGLALAGPLGEVFHSYWPTLFLDPRPPSGRRIRKRADPSWVHPRGTWPELSSSRRRRTIARLGGVALGHNWPAVDVPP